MKEQEFSAENLDLSTLGQTLETDSQKALIREYPEIRLVPGLAAHIEQLLDETDELTKNYLEDLQFDPSTGIAVYLYDHKELPDEISEGKQRDIRESRIGTFKDNHVFSEDFFHLYFFEETIDGRITEEMESLESKIVGIEILNTKEDQVTLKITEQSGKQSIIQFKENGFADPVDLEI